MRIHHVTDASSSGVLASVTTLARAQSELPDADVAFTYVPRHDSPPLEEIRALCGPAVTVRRGTAHPRLAVPALTLQLARILAGERDAAVHLHSSRAGLIGRVLAVLTGARSRTLYSPHCFAFDRTDLDPVRRRALLALEQIGTLLGPRLVLVSATEEDLAQHSLPRPRTAVLANRVPVESLRRHRTGTDAPRDTGSGDVLAIVHVGRIAAQKRPAAFRSIAEAWDTDPELPPARFTWIGEG
ncbi:MAG: glycosyl transferase family 1, partial [Brachybacterium sp.]|nr:glycosyl transferase family 1 [Brachybacterium sp.]